MEDTPDKPEPKAEQDAEPKAEEPKPKAEEPKAQEPKPKAEEPKPKAEEAPSPPGALRLMKAGATFGVAIALLALIGWAARAAMSSPPPQKSDPSRVQAEPPPRERAPLTNAMLGLEVPDSGSSQLDQVFDELRKSREAGLFDVPDAQPSN